jgi:hypothetical protein
MGVTNVETIPVQHFRAFIQNEFGGIRLVIASCSINRSFVSRLH